MAEGLEWSEPWTSASGKVRPAHVGGEEWPCCRRVSDVALASVGAVSVCEFQLGHRPGRD